MGKVNIKRIYSTAKKTDGFRILVDRLWPRGVSKESAKLDLWLKEIAPSTELRQWFHASAAPDGWQQFKAKYLLELDRNPAVEVLRDVVTKHEKATLLYAVNDEMHNHAQILKELIAG